MNKENKLHFNTEPLFIDLNNIIQTGVNNLLSDFITNYKLYEETHNCIMNLPSVKREISKSIETYKNDENEDLPDLISISSDNECDTHYIFYDNAEKPCDVYTRIPIQDDSDEELNDTILCMKKVTNQLLKEKEEINALFQQEINSYKEIIEKCNIEISYLKNQLTSSVIVPELTDNNEEEETIENIDIKVEKENIVLHIEEESNNDVLDEEDNTDEDEEDQDEEEDEDEDEEDQDEEEDEDEQDQDEEEDEEEEQEDDAVEEQYEEVGDVEEVDEDVVEEQDEVETEESDDAESKNDEEAAEEEELFEIEIDDVTYCTNDEENGFIYEIDKDGNVGDVIGHFKDSEPFFNKLF
jgi:hypothetical protein